MDQGDNSENTSVSESKPATHKRRRRKRKPSEELLEEKKEENVCHFDNPIHQHISQMGEDIVNISDNQLSSPNPIYSIKFDNITNSSSGKLFVERTTGAFKAIDHDKLEKLQLKKLFKEPEIKNVPEISSKTVTDGLVIHLYLQKLGKLCQGLLAGFAIYHLITVCYLGPPHFAFPYWINLYFKLAGPTEAIFYLLCVICLWSLLARCNIGGEEGTLCEQLKQLYLALFVIAIYSTVLILSLSFPKVDVNLVLRLKNESAIEEYAKEHLEDIQRLKTVNLFRCIGAAISWLILCVAYPRDHTRAFLEKIFTEPLTAS